MPKDIVSEQAYEIQQLRMENKLLRDFLYCTGGNFFSIFKTECIYRHKPSSFSEANEMIDRYIHFYNHERIQLNTGEAPLAQRLSA